MPRLNPLRPLLVLTLSALLPAAAQTPDQAFLQRTQWWREAKFGLFIHWGVYSMLGRGEWVMHNEKIPIPVYEKLQPRFNPVDFDAPEWVAIAKSAGMKYMTFTSKHHDGFCMFDSKLTTYDSMNTPAHRDFVKELVDACHAADMKICFYYSLLDWHHPEYAKGRPGGEGDFAKYVEYMHGQLRELCTNYGKIDGIWFDGGWEHSAEEWRSKELIAMIRRLQPHIMINNRAKVPEDFDTPEQHVPGGALAGGRLWETCMTINGHWGYAKNDYSHKSVRVLVHTLVDIMGKGGNFLLNVGPTPRGKIPQEDIARLAGVGRWMAVNGEAIYGTTAGPFRVLPWGRCTRKGDTLYLHVFDWPAGPLEVPGLQNEILSARLLCSPEKVEFRRSANGWTLRGPEFPPDEIDTVIALKIRGEPRVEFHLEQADDGTVTLPARLADVHGSHARYESGGGKDNIGYWVDQSDWVSWNLRLKAGGKFEVQVTYACAPGSFGSKYDVVVGDQKVSGEVKSTGDWAKFTSVNLGTIELTAGKHQLAVKPTSMPHGAVMNLQKVLLRPLK